MRQYNVVWADDEINILLDEFTKENLKRDGICVVGEAAYSEELESILEKLNRKLSIHKPDAVIVDGNYGRKNIQVQDKMTSGLTHSLALIEKYPSLPFFLYTKRKEEQLKQIYAEGELDYFEKQNRWFEKGQVGFKNLIKRIKEVVDEQATPEFNIRNRYAREFKIAKLISGAEDTILKSLLIEMGVSNADSVDYYTSLRKIIEGMFEICRNVKIIPDIKELNACCTFLENKHKEYYIVEGEKIMHEALVYALRYTLNMTQDASHNKEELKLRTDEYARKVYSNHVFYSILHITMDLLLWFGDTIEKIDSERVAIRWNKRNLEEVNIEKIVGKYAYAGNYKIIINKYIPLNVGDIVLIMKANEDGTVNWNDYLKKS